MDGLIIIEIYCTKPIIYGIFALVYNRWRGFLMIKYIKLKSKKDTEVKNFKEEGIFKKDKIYIGKNGRI